MGENTLVGSDLYQRLMAFYDEHNRHNSELHHKVWDGTPWMVNAYTGSSCSDTRYAEMMEWCHERFGEPSWPFSDDPRSGDWRSGNATVYGWTYFGFKTETMMNEFAKAWPNPPSPTALENTETEDLDRILETIHRPRFSLQRDADYPPELHKATDEYENAVNALTDIRCADDWFAGVDRLARAKRNYGRLLLKLDKQRRPEAYADG